MKREDLFEAIGQMDEDFLAANETMPVRSMNRGLWRVVLVAAILASLTVTAAAAGYVWKEIYGGGTELTMDGQMKLEEFEAQGENVVHVSDVHHIWLDVTLEEDAPLYITTYYLPQLDGDWVQVYGSKIEGEAHFLWRDESDPKRRLLFEQKAGRRCSTGVVDGVTTPWNAPLTSGTRTIGDMQVFEVKMPDYSDGIMSMGGFRRIYWTDGYYIYFLECPYAMKDKEIRSIIESIEEVEDISGYLGEWQ